MSVQLDYICTRPKIVETNDEICVGHLRAFSTWIMMMIMMIAISSELYPSSTSGCK